MAPVSRADWDCRYRFPWSQSRVRVDASESTPALRLILPARGAAATTGASSCSFGGEVRVSIGLCSVESIAYREVSAINCQAAPSRRTHLTSARRQMSRRHLPQVSFLQCLTSWDAVAMVAGTFPGRG